MICSNGKDPPYRTQKGRIMRQHCRAPCITVLPCLMLADFRALGKIGEGTFSDVLKIQSLIDGKYYACKRMKQKYSRLAGWHEVGRAGVCVSVCLCVC